VVVVVVAAAAVVVVVVVIVVVWNLKFIFCPMKCYQLETEETKSSCCYCR